MTVKVIVPEASIEFDRKFLKRVLRQAGAQVVAAARSLIKTGEGVSQPGEAPNSRSGVLARSMRVRAGRGLTVKITDNAIYAAALEGGAIGGGNRKGGRNTISRTGRTKTVVQASTQRVLAPRPFLSTALDNLTSSITDQIETAIDRGVDLKMLAKGLKP